jgi:hypothetical protein
MNGNASFEAPFCELRRDVAPGVLNGPRAHPWGSMFRAEQQDLFREGSVRSRKPAIASGTFRAEGLRAWSMSRIEKTYSRAAPQSMGFVYGRTQPRNEAKGYCRDQGPVPAAIPRQGRYVARRTAQSEAVIPAQAGISEHEGIYDSRHSKALGGCHASLAACASSGDSRQQLRGNLSAFTRWGWCGLNPGP